MKSAPLRRFLFREAVDDLAPGFVFRDAGLALAEQRCDQRAGLVEEFERGDGAVFRRLPDDPGAGDVVFAQMQVEGLSPPPT